MPTMLAIPSAISKDKEHELDQEFELDIRVSSVTTLPVLATAPTGGCCYTKTCGTYCGTCHTCTCVTCHIVGGHCINTDNC